jgi:hypothetical protein
MVARAPPPKLRMMTRTKWITELGFDASKVKLDEDDWAAEDEFAKGHTAASKEAWDQYRALYTEFFMEGCAQTTASALKIVNKKFPTQPDQNTQPFANAELAKKEPLIWGGVDYVFTTETGDHTYEYKGEKKYLVGFAFIQKYDQNTQLAVGIEPPACYPPRFILLSHIGAYQNLGFGVKMHEMLREKYPSYPFVLELETKQSQNEKKLIQKGGVPTFDKLKGMYAGRLGYIPCQAIRTSSSWASFFRGILVDHTMIVDSIDGDIHKWFISFAENTPKEDPDVKVPSLPPPRTHMRPLTAHGGAGGGADERGGRKAAEAEVG